jgi:hypothetical protein
MFRLQAGACDINGVTVFQLISLAVVLPAVVGMLREADVQGQCKGCLHSFPNKPTGSRERGTVPVTQIKSMRISSIYFRSEAVPRVSCWLLPVVSVKKCEVRAVITVALGGVGGEREHAEAVHPRLQQSSLTVTVAFQVQKLKRFVNAKHAVEVFCSKDNNFA